MAENSIQMERDELWEGRHLVGTSRAYGKSPFVCEVGKEIGTAGIDFGRVVIKKVYSNQVFLAHRKGRKVWNGTGMQTYAEPAYYIISHDGKGRVSEAYEVSFGRQRKAGMAIIETKVSELLNQKNR